MLTRIVDHPHEGKFEQGVWIRFDVGEYHVAKQILESLREMYVECGGDPEPFDSILAELERRGHPQ